MDERALAGPCDTGDDGEDAEWDVDVDVAEVVAVRSPDLERTLAGAGLLLEGGREPEVLTGAGPRGAQALDGAGEADLAPGAARTGTEVDDVVGNADRLRFVLDDEDRVALVPELEEQPVHRLDVVRVEADRRFVEDIGDVGERRTEVAHELDPLRLSPGQRPRRPLEGEVAQPDVDEGLHRLAQGVEERDDRGIVDLIEPGGKVGDLHRAHLGDRLPRQQRRPCGGIEPGPLAFRADGEDDGPVDELADVLLHAVAVLRKE
ncbi:Uncharacterised protein [Mycobacteroides abscessus subsp. abscessus]|nr:Uncharacterised protein [Mycobacteroides abscessus subsp. abscessus]